MSNVLTLKRNYEFRRVYSKGKSAAAPHLVLYARRNGGGRRLGITVGGKVGKAVVRNRVRRRLKEIYRLNQGRLRSGVDLVVVARVRAVGASYAALEREFLLLAGRLGLLEGGDRR